jgi:hypothetical protein
MELPDQLRAFAKDTHYGAALTMREAADEIERLKGIVSHLAVPVGWKLVPIRATEEMLQAAEKAEDDFTKAESGMWCGLQDYYKAMVRAAPDMTPNTN